MKSDDFDWGDGVVKYWDMAGISKEIELSKQLDELKEDLAQVYYTNDVLLDIGWYPEFASNGAFVVTVVEHRNWDEPLLKIKVRSISLGLGAGPDYIVEVRIAQTLIQPQDILLQDLG